MTLHCLPHYIRVFSTDIWWDVELRESPSFSSTMAVGAFSLSLAAILFLARADSDFLGGFRGRTWQWMYVIRIALLWLKLLCEIVKWLKILHCKNYDWKVCHLVYPHLLECERHALLHIHPEVRLLSEDLTGDQGSGGNHLVLLTTRVVILWSNYYFSNLQLSTYSL